jgi:hypothetical protein
MTDLTNPRVIYAKGFLFLVAGVLAAGILLAEQPTLRTMVLLTVCIWSFCRCYYFAFYVIEHYVDGEFRYAGLWAFLTYVWNRRLER